MKKINCLLTCFALFAACTLSSCQGSLDGGKEFSPADKTIVLTTSNLRGDIDKLARVSSLKADLEEKGASVLLADTGNFLQGTVYTSYDSGKTFLSLMKEAGYDAVTIGSHEFDFGTGKVGSDSHEVYYEDGTLGSFLSESGLTALSANAVTGEGGFAYTACKSYTLSNGATVALLGITDEKVTSQVLESNLSDLSFTLDTARANELLSALQADYSIVLSNASGYPPVLRAADKTVSVSESEGFVLSAVAFDKKGSIFEPKYSLDDYSPAPSVQEKAERFKATVDADEDFKDRATCFVALNGSQKDNRSRETNLGDFWTDAIRWYALHNALETADGQKITLAVDADHTIALWNGGNLRDYLNLGDVVMKDIKRVLPYPNKIAVLYLTGAELIEFLESGSQGLPFSDATKDSLASFFQVSGCQYTVDTSVPYEKGEAYGKCWYKDNAVGNRVSVREVNGKALEKDAIYAVITSNAVANGMDANYLSLTEGREKTFSSCAVTDAVFAYLKEACGGSIGEQYAAPQGRITIL